jgi:hypothetical protein
VLFTVFRANSIATQPHADSSRLAMPSDKKSNLEDGNEEPTSLDSYVFPFVVCYECTNDADQRSRTRENDTLNNQNAPPRDNDNENILQLTQISELLGATSSPDPGRVAELLAISVRLAVTALHTLQIALMDSSPPSRDLRVLLDDIRILQGKFIREWTRIEILLEQCYRYSEDFIVLLLCGFVFDGENYSDVWGLFDNVSSSAQNVLREVKLVKARHKDVSQQLVKRMPTLSAASETGIPPPSSDHRAAHVSLHPTATDALVTLYDSLGQIDKALGDLVVFWKGHVDQMYALERRAKLPFSKGQSRTLADRWRRHRSALQESISSISVSLSAVEVEPILGPYNSRYGEGSHAPPVATRSSPPSIWAKLFSVNVQSRLFLN